MLVGPKQWGFRAVDDWADPRGCEAQLLNWAEPQVLGWTGLLTPLVEWTRLSLRPS